LRSQLRRCGYERSARHLWRSSACSLVALLRGMF
jgi:hypothetical protein